MQLFSQKKLVLTSFFEVHGLLLFQLHILHYVHIKSCWTKFTVQEPTTMLTECFEGMTTLFLNNFQ